MANNEENVNQNDQNEEENIYNNPAIAPSLTAGLGAVYLRNKLKSVQNEK